MSNGGTYLQMGRPGSGVGERAGRDEVGTHGRRTPGREEEEREGGGDRGGREGGREPLGTLEVKVNFHHSTPTLIHYPGGICFVKEPLCKAGYRSGYTSASRRWDWIP